MALIVAQMVERRITALVFLIDQHRMALRERAAFGILSREPHMVALLQQGAERQRLAGRPVDADPGVDRLRAVVEEALNGAMNAEAVGDLGDLAADILQNGSGGPGHAAGGVFFLVGNLEARPLAVEPVGLVGLVAGAGLELGIEPRAPVGLGLLALN